MTELHNTPAATFEEETPKPRAFGAASKSVNDTKQDHMSALDILLSADSGRVTDDIKITKRQGLAADLILTIGSLTDLEFKACANQAEVPVGNRAQRRRPGGGGETETDGNLLQRLIVVAGVVSPDLNDSRLLTQHSCYLAEELVQKIFLPGEINSISEWVMDLSGFNQSSVESVSL